MNTQIELFRADIEASFLERPNRFIILARLDSSEVVRAHTANPGRMLELLQPGARVILQLSDRRERKTPYTVVAVRRPSDRRTVPLVSVAANTLARELVLPSIFEGPAQVRSEVVRGGSRFDFLVESAGEKTWVEVKSCTLEAQGVAMFPDAATERGRRHVEELASITTARRMILFVIQGLPATRFVPDVHADPAFALALREAVRAGVEVRAATVNVSPQGKAWLENPDLPVDFSPLAAVDRDAGVYIVTLRVPEAVEVAVGKLGLRRFDAGYYIYVGSGHRNLSARIRRHLSKRKRMHWHIDYLREVAIEPRGYPIFTLEALECELAADLSALYPAGVEGFGSSDCRCRSHLFYTPDDPRRDPVFVELLLRYRHDRSLPR